MKRSLYDSEYERVRREADLGRHRPEFPEDDEPPPAPDPRSAELMRAARDDFKKRMDAWGAQETERRAAAKAEADRYTREVNARMVRREYESLGLTPPTPLVSLALLLRLGWTVEQHIDFDDQKINTLVRPTGLPELRSQSEI